MVKGVGFEVRPKSNTILLFCLCDLEERGVLNISEPQFLALYNGFLIGLLIMLDMTGHIGFCSWLIRMPLLLYASSPYQTAIMPV